MAQCYVATKSTLESNGKQGRWYSGDVRTRNHDQETRFITYVKANHDAEARNQGWKSNFDEQGQDTQVNFGKND
jgi:hypothetical protein